MTPVPPFEAVEAVLLAPLGRRLGTGAQDGAARRARTGRSQPVAGALRDGTEVVGPTPQIAPGQEPVLDGGPGQSLQVVIGEAVDRGRPLVLGREVRTGDTFVVGDQGDGHA